METHGDPASNNTLVFIQTLLRCRQVGTAFAQRRQSLSKAASLLQRGNELSPGVVSTCFNVEQLKDRRHPQTRKMIRKSWNLWKGIQRYHKFSQAHDKCTERNTARLKGFCSSGLKNCNNILSSAFASGRPVTSINPLQLRRRFLPKILVFLQRCPRNNPQRNRHACCS